MTCPTTRSPARSGAAPPPSARCSAAGARRCARTWRPNDMIDELLAPLAAQEPTDDEIRQLLARADRRTKRRRIRVASATAVTAGAALTALAALPSAPTAPPAGRSPLSAGALLSTAPAVAAEQPGPADWAG